MMRGVEAMIGRRGFLGLFAGTLGVAAVGVAPAAIREEPARPSPLVKTYDVRCRFLFEDGLAGDWLPAIQVSSERTKASIDIDVDPEAVAIEIAASDDLRSFGSNVWTIYGGRRAVLCAHLRGDQCVIELSHR